MTKVAVYNNEGVKQGDVTLPEGIFGLPANDALVHQVYVAQGANRRSGSAHTKIRSEIRGGGKKPWKQKGTGNARTGSIRNPIWRGGGTIFGPLKENNYTKAINAKMKRKALLIALSGKAQAGKVVIAETLVLPEKKTKSFITFLKGASVEKSFVVGFSTTEQGYHTAVRNVPKSKTMEVEKLNVYDLLNAEYIIVSKDGLKQMEAHYAGTIKETK